MKVLLLYPEDSLPQFETMGPWDLVIDLARAPAATCESWQAGCPVISIHQFAQEVDDLYYLKKLLRAGLGRMVDGHGIDWWDVLSLEVAADLRQIILIRRLARELSAGCELYVSRPNLLATALRSLTGGKLINLEGTAQRVIGGVRRRWHSLSHLDAEQTAQVLEDKFDSQHVIRRRFTPRRNIAQATILMPTAYVNSSRIAVAYAESLPAREFTLIYTRRSGRLPAVPDNVCQVSLSPYFVQPDEREFASLLDSWTCARKLMEAASEFRLASASGLFEGMPSLLRWGVSLRDAWNEVFETADIAACLCTDDSNPPTRIPLLLAKNRGLSSVAVHHGALDYAMAFKTQHADFYLAKTKMEEDYLARICRVPKDKLVLGGPAHLQSVRQATVDRSQARWMAFFTEPYQNYAWRSDEVYRDLLSRIYSLAQVCSLKLVLKLHPFESARSHRKLLRRILKREEHNVEIISGPLHDDLWPNIRLALTVQSSTALECVSRSIPIFLCAWLRDSYSGYVAQFERFAVGRVLESPEQISDIPRLLEEQSWKSAPGAECRPIDPEMLTSLLSGSYSLPAVCNA